MRFRVAGESPLLARRGRSTEDAFGGISGRMPKARPPLAPHPPSPLEDWERTFIKETVERFFGADAIVRNFGPDPRRLQIHVETSRDDGLVKDDCVGVLNCKIERDAISLTVTKQGTRIWGSAKVAYRQGVII